jgi:filamentous hemagglutinin family protein
MIRLVPPQHKNQLSVWRAFQEFCVRIGCSQTIVTSLMLWLGAIPSLSIWDINPVQAQSIVPAPDGTSTIVTPDGNRIDISGGQLSGDKANLFHSFTQFGLNPEQIANFLSNPNIQNILGRVVGGDPSIIRGLIQVSGGNSNLFLMNPSGIVFGPSASLNVPGSFTATTANGIGFGSNWFNASGANNYTALVGNPNTFSFSMTQPGAIVNAGDLAVGQGQNLTLLGGTVASVGSLSAPEGQVLVTAVPGEKFIRLSQPGSPLSLEILPPSTNSAPQNWNLPIIALPQLLTAGGGGNASQLETNNDGTVRLSGSGISVVNGDVVTGNVTAKTATLSAKGNLTSVESQLSTTGDLNLLAGDTVRIRDSIANPFVAKAGGNLLIQGNQNIDILALNHPTTPFQSGGNLTLASDGVISGDSHFASGGNFSILNLAGNPGKFVSLYDPIISSTGNISFGSYSGAALKVEAVGDIEVENITITSPDTFSSIPSTDPDFSTLTTSRALIMRAGLSSVSSSSTPLPIPGLTGGLASSLPASPEGNITVNGSINTSNSDGPGGPVELSARGNVTVTGIINTGFGNVNKGNVGITSSNGSISVLGTDGNANSVIGRSITINNPGALSIEGSLNARNDSLADVGNNVTIGNILVPTSITVGDISTRNLITNGGGGGNISITTSGSFNATRAFDINSGNSANPTDANTASIASQANGSGGTININAGGSITTASAIFSNSLPNGTQGDIDDGGSIALNAGGNISIKQIQAGTNDNRRSGNVSINSSSGGVNIFGIDNNANSIVGKFITINAPGAVNIEGALNARIDSAGNTGNITIGNIQIPSSINVGTASTRNLGNGSSGNINIRTSGTFNTTRAADITTGNPSNPNASNTFSIGSEAANGSGGTINISADGGITTTSAIVSNSRSNNRGGNITLNSNAGNVNVEDVISSGNLSAGTISISGNNITTENINANGGASGAAIAITGRGNITTTTGEINVAGRQQGGSVNIQTTGGNVTTQAIKTEVFADDSSTSSVTASGPINVSATGSITATNLISFFNGSSPSGSRGGDIKLEAGGAIAVGKIDSFSNQFNPSSSSQGGSVTLTGSNIQFEAINTQSSASGSSSSVGGNVAIAANGVPNGTIRGTAFIERPSFDESFNFPAFPANTTIFTGGNTQSGSIAITHNGDANNVPFIVGNATTNGTLGALNAGSSSVIAPTSPVNQFPVLPNGGNASGTPSGITITSVNSPPTLTVARSQFSSEQRNRPITITYTDLNPVVNDVNRDNTTIRIEAIATGTLRKNDSVVVPGTQSAILSPGDTLEYTPPSNSNSNINAFTISASDGVSSTPININVDVRNTPPTLTANSPLTGAQVNSPFIISYEELNPRANDVNGDPTTILIDNVLAGTLRKNGSIVTSGTPFSSGETLEYTPPANTIGVNNAFALTASDGITSSPQVPIAVNVGLPEIPPETTDDVQRDAPTLPTSTIPNVNISTSPTIDVGVSAIEDKFTQQYESYLGIDAGAPISIERSRDILNNIEKQAGIKPAIVYISFLPSGLDESGNQKEGDTDQLDLMVVTTKGEPIRKRISLAKRAQVQEVAQKLRFAVNDPNNVDNDDYLEPAQQLYKWMVAPLEAELQTRGIQNLLFITDTDLRSLPLATLHDGKQFLIEKYSIGFTPSLSLTNTKYVSIKNAQVLAMGASEFQDLPDLPAVPLELNIVAGELWKGKRFLNESFTLQNLTSLHKSQSFGIIHLATHGEFNKGEPKNSFIQLWDRRLRLPEFKNLELNNPSVELLVLSACRTAVGSKEAELGFGGLATQAGVKTAVASLWQVSDAGTLGLMTEFYQNLKTAPIKAEALRQAQIAMLRGKVQLKDGQLVTLSRGVSLPPQSPDAKQQRELTHPYYWSAFTMIGNPW